MGLIGPTHIKIPVSRVGWECTVQSKLHNTIWHDTAPYDMTQHNTKRHKMENIIFHFSKKIFFWNFFNLFENFFWRIFEDNFVSFCVVSYWYDTTHLDSLVVGFPDQYKMNPKLGLVFSQIGRISGSFYLGNNALNEQCTSTRAYNIFPFLAHC